MQKKTDMATPQTNEGAAATPTAPAPAARPGASWASKLIGVQGPLIGLVALCVIFSFATTAFLSFRNLLNILDQVTVLGILSSIEYQEHRMTLGYGDVLVIYSDGVTEACNGAHEDFGIDRLAGIVYRNQTQSARTILSEINRSIAEYTMGAPQADDTTLIVARRVAG